MKTLQLSVLALGLLCLTEAQLSQKRPDPVPILKQISKQNDDGSYSFGYEAGDGSYKIETKFPTGEVQGKYGYVDDEGKLREVEYGATSKEGFRPQGNGINIPPPPSANDVQIAPLADGEEDDGQYREDPSIYDTKAYKANRPVSQKASRRPPFSIFQESAQPVQQTYSQPAQQTYRQPAQQAYRQPAQQAYRQPAQTFSFSNFPQNSFQYQQPSQSLDYEEPQEQYSGYQKPSAFSFQQPSAGRFFNNFQTQPQTQYQTQPQPQYQTQPRYQTYTQPQYQSYQQPVAFNYHPSVKNFDIGTGSYSINYSGR